MLTMVATEFTGYGGLKEEDRSKPIATAGRVLVRLTAAAINPLDYTILSGGHPRAKAPLILGNEGVGVIDQSNLPSYPAGSRVMFTGPYGAREDGTWQQYLLVRPEELCLIPESVDDVTAAAVTVGYLTAYLTLRQAKFERGKSVLAPAIGGSVGNATYQLAHALGASVVVSTAGSSEKAKKAQEAGFGNIIDLSREELSDGVRRLTDNAGVDVVIDSIGGAITSGSLSAMAMGGSLVSLGYSADRKTTIDVTDIIWKDLKVTGFSLFRATPAEIREAWDCILPLLVKGSIKPLIDRTFPLENAGEALRYLIEQRPFGKVILTIGR
ncbi:MAG: zinc-binding alcohol dehydrogenase family protein [Pseudomonadota bacterium]